MEQVYLFGPGNPKQNVGGGGEGVKADLGGLASEAVHQPKGKGASWALDPPPMGAMHRAIPRGEAVRPIPGWAGLIAHLVYRLRAVLGESDHTYKHREIE